MDEFPIELQSKWQYTPSSTAISGDALTYIIGGILLCLMAILIYYYWDDIKKTFSKSNKSVAVIAVLALVGILFFSGTFAQLPGLFSDDYSTGLNINTNTVVEELKKDNYDPNKNVVFIKDAGREIFTRDKYVCSWLPRENSQLITMRSDFMYDALVTENWLLGSEESVTLSRYYVTVDYIDTTGNEIRIIDTHNGVNTAGDMWDTNYVEMDENRFPPSSRYIATGGGGHLLPNVVYKNVDWLEDDPSGKWREVIHGDYQGYEELSTDTFEFHMKGLRVGALRTNYYIETAMRHDDLLGWHWEYKGFSHYATDECYLASGEGNIKILSTNSIGAEGQKKSQYVDEDDDSSYGETYTKYVFEEKSEIEFEIDTGYSGSSLLPSDEGYGDGWTLALYDSRGVQVYTWRLPDNLRGRKITYTVPSGAFIPGGENEWRLVLKNTLFDQAEIRLFVVDSSEKVPGKTTVTLDKTQYKEGDTVQVSLSANANPAGTGQITRFYVLAKYGDSSSTYYIEGFPRYITASKSSGTTYTASFTFELEKTRPITLTNMYVRAHALDSAGRAGVEGETTNYVEQSPPSTNPIDIIPTMTENNGLIYLLVVAVVAIVLLYVFILYRQGKISFKGLKKK